MPYLSSPHEKFVELVRLTFEKECLGRILVQQSDWVVNLDVETSLDPLQFLLDSFVHHNLALVIFQLVRTAPISRDCSKNNDAIAEQTLKERENRNQRLIFALSQTKAKIPKITMFAEIAYLKSNFFA